MHRHVFSNITARVENGSVRLAFYLTTPVFESLPAEGWCSPIRVLRTCEPRFIWGRDYAEYFEPTGASGTERRSGHTGRSCVAARRQGQR